MSTVSILMMSMMMSVVMSVMMSYYGVCYINFN